MSITDQVLTISNAYDSIDLYPWLTGGPNQEGVEALSGIEGFGWTDQTNRWFEGAGDGAIYRGSRLLPRVVKLPLWVREADRSKLNELLGRLSLLLNPMRGPARITFGLPGGELWYIDVIRESGGDIVRASKDSDNQTWFKTTIMLKAGSPYWTKLTPVSLLVTEDKSGRGLLPNLAELQVSYSGAFGSLTVTNQGDGPSPIFWTLGGPFTRVYMSSSTGGVLEWVGSVAQGHTLYIDPSGGGQVYDDEGTNLYDNLGLVPKFWKMLPGQTQVQVVMDGTNSYSFALGLFNPLKWAVI